MMRCPPLTCGDVFYDIIEGGVGFEAHANVYSNVSNKSLASCKSAVSNPSVNQS
jgi:hypothetical protein